MIILQPQIDLIEIQKQLIEIHKQIDSSDSFKTFSFFISILSPLIVGVLIFQLNKDKDYHSKKSEICGEMYGYMMELKLIIKNVTRLNVLIAGYNQIERIRLSEIEEKGEEDRSEYEKREEFRRDLKVRIDESKNYFELYKILMPKLSTTMGKFRLYLSRKKRKEFDVLSNNVLNIKPYEYSKSFYTFWSDWEVDTELGKINDTYNDDLNKKNFIHINHLQEFIDDNVSLGPLTEIE